MRLSSLVGFDWLLIVLANIPTLEWKTERCHHSVLLTSEFLHFNIILLLGFSAGERYYRVPHCLSTVLASCPGMFYEMVFCNVCRKQSAVLPAVIATICLLGCAVYGIQSPSSKAARQLQTSCITNPHTAPTALNANFILSTLNN